MLDRRPAAMWMFAAIVDEAGNVVVRVEGEVSNDADISVLAGAAINRFRRANPDTSLLDEVGNPGFTIRFGTQG